MNARAILVTPTIVALLACAACAGSPGAPRAGSVVLPPNQVLEFNLLFTENCAGCHGPDGKGGAAIALANPVFLAIADDAVIRAAAANGVLARRRRRSTDVGTRDFRCRGVAFQPTTTIPWTTVSGFLELIGQRSNIGEYRKRDVQACGAPEAGFLS